MLFSIVTVTFNDFENLLSTYKSVFSQTFQGFEWIVVDGNSTDNTVEFLNQVDFEQKIFISEPDKGLYDAMNKGIALSKGNYIIFLNAGDVFDNSDILSNVSKKIKGNPQLIYGDSKESGSDGQFFYKKSRPFWWHKIGMFTHHQAMFYNRKVVIEKNIRYNQKYTIAGDYDFTINIIKSADNVIYLPFSLCIFQQGGLSHSNWKDGLRQQDEIRKKRLNMLLLTRKFIYMMQYCLHIIRFNFNGLYNIYRFSKENN